MSGGPGELVTAQREPEERGKSRKSTQAGRIAEIHGASLFISSSVSGEGGVTGKEGAKVETQQQLRSEKEHGPWERRGGRRRAGRHRPISINGRKSYVHSRNSAEPAATAK